MFRDGLNFKLGNKETAFYVWRKFLFYQSGEEGKGGFVTDRYKFKLDTFVCCFIRSFKMESSIMDRIYQFKGLCWKKTIIKCTLSPWLWYCDNMCQMSEALTQGRVWQCFWLASLASDGPVPDTLYWPALAIPDQLRVTRRSWSSSSLLSSLSSWLSKCEKNS